uniref:Uncharacterized protein n=1 Tax=Oryza sativa subsp. japonica TaxID=39947 RepID=Q6K331_ORYSJ|nr:hypothetical protein [Oryza sativa Japonica Group]BAD23539.1 hypothetical protein [Oryza sativa Japonica Group]
MGKYVVETYTIGLPEKNDAICVGPAEVQGPSAGRPSPSSPRVTDSTVALLSAAAAVASVATSRCAEPRHRRHRIREPEGHAVSPSTAGAPFAPHAGDPEARPLIAIIIPPLTIIDRHRVARTAVSPPLSAAGRRLVPPLRQTAPPRAMAAEPA